MEAGHAAWIWYGHWQGKVWTGMACETAGLTGTLKLLQSSLGPATAPAPAPGSGASRQWWLLCEPMRSRRRAAIDSTQPTQANNDMAACESLNRATCVEKRDATNSALYHGSALPATARPGYPEKRQRAAAASNARRPSPRPSSLHCDIGSAVCVCVCVRVCARAHKWRYDVRARP